MKGIGVKNRILKSSAIGNSSEKQLLATSEMHLFVNDLNDINVITHCNIISAFCGKKR